MDSANSSEIMDGKTQRCNKNVHNPSAFNIEKKVKGKKIKKLIQYQKLLLTFFLIIPNRGYCLHSPSIKNLDNLTDHEEESI